MVDNRTRVRLTGAAILVALIVLLVPELLSRPQHTRPQQAAAVDEAPIRSYRLSLGDSQQSTTPVTPVTPATSGASGTSGVAPTASAAPGPTGPAPAASAAPPISGASPARLRPPAPLPSPARSSAPPPSQTATAHAQRHAESRATAARRSVAPGPPRAARAELAARAEKGGKAARAESTPGGWAVQVGSFGSRENADRLVHDLKLKGYGAFISESPSRGRTWYRVRVGPERSRAAADATAARLRAAGLRGAVAQAR